MASLSGTKELRRRLRAIRQTFKPVGRRWADDTVRGAKARVPKRTGKTAASIRRKNASQKRASVQAIYTARIVIAGSRAHRIEPRKAEAMRFQPARIGGGSSGQAVFRKRVQHPGHRGNDFAEAAAKEALRDNPMAEELIRLWNEAA